MKRTYPIICPSCQGRGEIVNPSAVTANLSMPCKACNRVGVVAVIEEGDVVSWQNRKEELREKLMIEIGKYGLPDKLITKIISEVFGEGEK